MSDSINVQKQFVAQARAEFQEAHAKWCADPANMARLQEAVDMVLSGKVLQTATPHHFLIPSNSTMGTIYAVDRQARSCSCPDFRFRQKMQQPAACKHRIAVHLAVRAIALEFEFKDWSKAFDTFWVARGTDDEAEAYERLAGWAQ